MKITKTQCEKCGTMIRNNNIKKHSASCSGEQNLSWFIRKANNLEIKLPKRVEDINWHEVQICYDGGMSTTEICNAFNITFTKISQAGKLGLFHTRSRRETSKIRGTTTKGRICSADERQKRSDSMNRAVREGRQRTPKPYGKSSIAYKGIILQSKWELQVAKYMDENNIKWERPIMGHEYTFESNTHLYFPDFYLIDCDTYIEVKGWKQPKDECKWKDFKFKLKIIDRTCINNLDNFFNEMVGLVGFEPTI